jgi:hypothetical protein
LTGSLASDIIKTHKTTERFFMEPTRIQWTLGYTVNVGNFQSLRLDCQITDYKHEAETAKEASDRVYAFVEQELVEKLNQAKEELG